MAETERLGLRQQIVENYDSLIARLTRRLGSSEHAYDVLHETFVRLDSVPATTQVLNPASYIFRTALNIERNRRKAQSYRVSVAEIDSLVDVCDETPDPAMVAEARSDFKAFERALLDLPERPRQVLRLMSLEGKTAQETADHLNVSVRTVAADYQNALQQCAKSLNRTPVVRLGGPRPRP
ncbi:RNA polymerase subunit sigma-24 [Rhodoblastus sphagnicola]|uniref:RNA polymerase subunit sigma-24 n=1 Tax=Rhodoblastus sphagnicola TaxID=333368 RepID=A0A2S6NAV6_9HYPH|nr:sigma-70 family RNA polymerase sigma factor [Rhodoblastus sphagnicola]MBB4198993.1 RNA polymerase sigma-70 factor (ECF subfamily) [Rhodoblastus sphagnicola]PPQ31748.1 RNA polymerase subunit sigma-24 [Rhodoblastus sphagnicola]